MHGSLPRINRRAQLQFLQQKGAEGASTNNRYFKSSYTKTLNANGSHHEKSISKMSTSLTGIQNRATLKQSLGSNASAGIERFTRQSATAAGLPSGFASNVTARNQFTKVRARPIGETLYSHDGQRRFVQRDASGSSSPKGRAGAESGEADLESDPVLTQRNQHRQLYTRSPGKSGTLATSPPFNRFASDKNLLLKRPDSYAAARRLAYRAKRGRSDM